MIRPRPAVGTTAAGIAAALAAAVAGAVVVAAPAVAQNADDAAHPEYLGRTHYTGEFHSHTSISDGQALPVDAFTHVAENSDADFFGLAEHDVTFDLRNADDFITDWRDAASDEWRYLHEESEAFNANSDLETVIGEELTWYDGTGHMNIFNADWLATANSPSGGTFGTGNIMYDLPTMYARLALDPEAVAQFNHPGATGWGDFYDFSHLTPTADESVQLFEYKSPSYHSQWILALDNGWHLSPTYSGDEHARTWVTGNPATTGIWATEQSADGLYQAMRERSTYATFDADAILQLGANGRMMGSILPAGTTELTLDVDLTDPEDTFETVQVYTNGGEVAAEFTDLDTSTVSVDPVIDVADGDYYFVKATQADGEEVISAPVWIGERVRGANYAPEITVADTLPASAADGEVVALPEVIATDDSGAAPQIDITVFTGSGELPVADGTFTVTGHDDHFVVVKATDGNGSTAADLVRTTVTQDQLDPDTVFRHQGTVAAVGARPGEAGVTAVTDRSITETYLQVLPAGASDWAAAQTVASDGGTVFEMDRIAREAKSYQDSITGQVLRSHEFDLTALTPGERYQYRLGVTPEGGWTDVAGEFVAGGETNEPIYVLGDLQVVSSEPADYALFDAMLERLRAEHPGGDLLVQMGDLVDRGGRAEYWDQAYEHVLDDLDLQVATMVGNHETYGDKEFHDVIADERSAIFAGMYNLPGNGSAVGESNYSFDRGDIHFAVLNSNYDLDTQLDWLIEDMRATDKPWKVVLSHFPYYGGNHSDDAGMANQRAQITEVLDQLGVNLHVGGHDHVYKRSTVYDGRLAETPEEEAAGTTFVTTGSAGPKFYNNQVQWWDDVVYDDDLQTGTVLEVTDAGLRLLTYNSAGETVDDYTVTKPESTWELSSARIVDDELAGVGFLSYPGAREGLTVTAVAMDHAQEETLAVRTADVTLNHSGTEQYVAFDAPLPVDPNNAVKIMVWDSLGSGRPLVPATVLREGVLGEGTAEEPFEVRTWADVENIRHAPEAHYALMNDIELDDLERAQIGSGTETFRGVFDGRGHAISGFRANADGGGGLFATNEGTIRDLAVTDADIDTTKGTIGILADYNTGTIENSWSSGSIIGQGRVGGLVGDSTGVVRDSYSTADVRSRSTEAGGVVAVALAGSTTENVYSTGNVTSDTRNVGGVVGYGYTGTTVRNVLSLNESVTAPNYAHAVVGRVLSGHTATLEGNLATDAAYVNVQSLDEEPAETNLKGRVVPADATRTQALYSDDLGWDLTDVWVWDEEAGRPLLRANTEDYVAKRPAGEPNADGYYEIASAEDLAQMSQYRSEKYVLTADLEVSGVSDWTPIGGLAPFTGELDGNGHTISGLTSTRGGLININNGTVHDLGIVDADVSLDGGRVGILANVNGGVVSGVYTTGSVSGTSRVGGVVGDSAGTVRDSYSTATVRSASTESGGVVGVALAGSVTENVYSTGAVSADTRNTGGVVGYGYTGTEIRNGIALNPSVTAPSYAHRFLGRVLSGNTATLENNWASAGVVASVQSNLDEPTATNWSGATASLHQTRDPLFFAETLGWDFESVWSWHDAAARPVLTAAPERYTGEPVPPLPAPELPALEQDTDGAYLIDEVADLAEVTAHPDQQFRLAADLDLTGQDVRIAPEGFTGVLDGAGHVVTGYTSDDGGLFPLNEGTITALSLDAVVTTTADNTGLLVDVNRGEISQVSTSGAISGGSTVGGVVGYSYGELRDSYSTADVTATGGRQAGGVAGITGRGSLTENVFATGRVEVVGNMNAGGVSGYAYTGTTLQNSVALNEAVVATGYAGRVVARVLSGDVATLVNNYGVETVEVGVETEPEEGTDTTKGATLTTEQATDRGTYENVLGWDFAAIWAWDDTSARPVLQHEIA
ncbi:metallophosphoesterase [Georgenia subflava]|uniref:Metallophosphoesterase n=1 Tax=Georgenia subflava TaxID=1622177 RepID=A0A6N7ED17_9MICO|nr:metallophosphoesterase [Georgenia subflava]MPV36312.1 metallophosphoesterase [Georgenia subflava]